MFMANVSKYNMTIRDWEGTAELYNLLPIEWVAWSQRFASLFQTLPEAVGLASYYL